MNSALAMETNSSHKAAKPAISTAAGKLPVLSSRPGAAYAGTGYSGSGYSGSGASPFAIRLEFFSGPMDLLLHLVHQQEVGIEQVKMSLVAEQYLEIVTRNARYLDLEKASEFLVIAATLLAIKSGSLLPSLPVPGAEDSRDDWVDTRFFEDLRQRLCAYELTKARAMSLVRCPQLGVDTFNRVDHQALKPTPEMLCEPEGVLQPGAAVFRV